ncbi:MAG TPA: CocE/NonD family hydrolase [Steroidobacteraceae bacterium]|nr:CocE/NonD family hydrolase [Steroidobacteraceae bacterium]
MSEGFELMMRPGVHPSLAPGRKQASPPQHSLVRENGLLIERNLRVPLRDGVRIYIDLYRPDTAQAAPLPVLLGWSPYGKHNTADHLPWPAADVPAGSISPYTAFEAPDPAYWCAHGYAIVYPDPRGSWYSEGELRHGGMGEAEDCYDLVEWLGTQSWCNGHVGMTGVSYLAAIQWQVAPLRPPHLRAINPWEGFSDWYREFAYHGGIPETGFVPRGCANLQWSITRTEDTAANVRAHPLRDAYWRSKDCDLAAIEVPAYVVASWSDQGLHTRGTLEAYRQLASPQKWLEVHGRKKWQYYYRPESLLRQRQFFDHFLKGTGSGLKSRPKVLLEIRESAQAGTFRAESEWPLARTVFQRLYLDAASGCLSNALPPAVFEVGYDPEAPDGRAVFEYRFDAETELTGHMKLRLWVEAVGANDMDLFVAVEKLDAAGHRVPFIFYATGENGPVALGWLRASHRALDAARSRPEQPVHSHTAEQPLATGECVPVEIEIWASATLFRKHDSLRLVVQGRDIPEAGPAGTPAARHEDTRNRGRHILRSGGAYDSHLLVPVIPFSPRP